MEHEHSEHHSHGSHGHHSRKYFENPEKYVYTEEELQAYRVPMKYRNKCVNLYIPYHECTKEIPHLRKILDPKIGKCSKEVNDYENCMKIYIHHQQNIHVMNSYYANPAKANKDVMSPSFEASFFKSPLAFSW